MSGKETDTAAYDAANDIFDLSKFKKMGGEGMSEPEQREIIVQAVKFTTLSTGGGRITFDISEGFLPDMMYLCGIANGREVIKLVISSAGEIGDA